MAVWLLSLVFSGCLALPGVPSPYHPGQDLIDITLQTQRESRIVGGGDAQINDFPWQASLESSGQHICGAIILNEDFVLTAAHCVGNSASSYTIHVGSSSLSGSGGSRHGVSAVTPHEHFINSGSTSIGAFPNDVAVMKLSSSISFNQNKQPISLTSVTNAQLAGYNEEDCVITGWGRTNGNGGSLPNILQKTFVKIMTDNACSVSLGSSLNSDIHICVDGAGTSGGCNSSITTPTPDNNYNWTAIKSPYTPPLCAYPVIDNPEQEPC
ncbi:Testisin [Mizuhopecten yessoensis]|uniref:Testisin n=1 Tax=Mizuhopecten yessoensis TaxID=6573 RepID=A0A210QA43_MIZYE|nr:Testisin [Mizuhopecten yessoensis]